MYGSAVYCGLQIYLVIWAHVSLALCPNCLWCMSCYMQLPIAFWDNQQISLADSTDRLKTNSLKCMLVNDIAFLLNFSDMNQLHWWPHVWVANNLLAHISVMIALGQTFGVMIVVSPVTKTILSIGFRCGIGSFSRNLIFSRGDLQYISPIIPTVALPFHSMLKLIIHLTLIYWMKWTILSINLSPHIHRNQEQTSNPNQN